MGNRPCLKNTVPDDTAGYPKKAGYLSEYAAFSSTIPATVLEKYNIRLFIMKDKMFLI